MGKSSNLPAKKYSAGERTCLRLSFEGTGNATQFIDIGLAMSVLNQRHYRSGLYYYVQSVEVYNNEDALIDLHTLPDNYTIKNAWNLGFRKYMEMNRLVDTPRGMWHDFRVYMNSLHRTTGPMMPSLHTINGGARALTSDDGDDGQQYLYSSFTTADDDGDATQEADNFFVHMIGDHDGSAGNWTAVGLCKSYNALRAQPETEEPSTHVDADTDPIGNLFDFSSEEMLNDITQNLESRGNQAPYDIDQVQGEHESSLYQVSRLVTSNGINRVAKGNGFPVPYGLICVDPSGASTAWRVVVNLVPGTYHGCYAERSI